MSGVNMEREETVEGCVWVRGANQPRITGSGLERDFIAGRLRWFTLCLDTVLKLRLVRLSTNCTSTSTDGSTHWLHRKGDTTRFSLSAAFHLGRDQDPQWPWARTGAMAGD